ncbi:MAG TPA: hypothetical protein VKV40_16225 [Ktedonobacteraceae bacterium]|nr:hypothetical protein [Ktedonobacteraceae bacterium]
MKNRTQNLNGRDRYRALVSLLIIPLGLIISVRAAMIGPQAWMLVVLGLAFVALGIVKLRSLMTGTPLQAATSRRRKRA